MTTASPTTVLRHIRDLVATESSGKLPDQQLLEQFTTRHEEAAFTTLVRRHGPLVLGVCRRVLHNHHDAEDAFQATFLVLARKAGSIKRGSVAGWLYQVAYHMAIRARARSANRQAKEREAVRGSTLDPLDEFTARELLTVLEEELHRLPERLRAPLVLCYLEGNTRDQAAKQLGWSLGTLKRRLEQGRERLRSRLAQRGLALSAGLLAAMLAQVSATAAVPAKLVASTVQAVLLAAVGGLAAAGVVSTSGAALADGALKAMATAKCKVAAALILAVTLVTVGAGTIIRGAMAGQQAAEEASTKPNNAAATSVLARSEVIAAVAAAEPDAPKKDEMIVTGKVLGPDGKPVLDAQVSVTANEQRLGSAKTDRDGRFRLSVRRTSSKKDYRVQVIAAAAGFGLGWQSLQPDAEQPQATVPLHPEQVFRGRLVDLQGQGAAGVKVYLAYVAQKDARRTEDSVGFQELHEKWSPWPAPVTTDKEGRFSISGLGRDLFIGFHIADDRFARQTLHRIETGNPENAKEVALVLRPAQVVEGRVTYADTGRPVPHASLAVRGVDREFGKPTFEHGEVTGQSDAEGRFRISSYHGNTITANIYPPPGTAYLAMRKELPWPKGGATKQKFDVALERGVLVRGRIADQDGKPVAGAAIDYWPQRADNPNFRPDVLVNIGNGVVSGADGSFRIAVLPGPGHLLVQGGTPDYLQREVYYDFGSGRITDSPGDNPNIIANGGRWRISGLAALNLKRDAEPTEIKIALRRGVTVKGRLVGPDGKPVAKAKMLCRLAVASTVGYAGLYPVDVSEGRFEVPGCDPEKTYPVYFLDAEHQWGAIVEISGKQAGGEPVSVRLTPCGSATVRFLNRRGQPLVKYRPNQFGMQLLVGSGHKANAKGTGESEMVWLLNVDRLHYGEPLVTDVSGRLTLPALIPGSKYRISERGYEREFTVQSGDTTKLEDMTLPLD